MDILADLRVDCEGFGREPLDEKGSRVMELTLKDHRLGKRLCEIDPKNYTMWDAVAFISGAAVPDAA